MKALVAFYSRTGNTKKAAEAIAKELGADLEEIIDHNKRSGIIGWLYAGRDAMKRMLTAIDKPKKDPAAYDLVILGSPLWAFRSYAPAVRTYMTENRGAFKKVAFFLTKGGSAGDKAIADMKETCGKHPITVLELLEKEVKSGSMADKIGPFCRSLKS
ncbi:MAG TPA: flavodoxin [Candidatus Omnitrophota bacterium]|nr:flavodoxin [Candidatus Omnitrophota bacterium]